MQTLIQNSHLFGGGRHGAYFNHFILGFIVTLPLLHELTIVLSISLKECQVDSSS